VSGHAGFVQECRHRMSDQRSCGRRLRDHAVAGHERRSDLTCEDCQRKIPRADADEHTAAMQGQEVLLTRGSLQLLHAKKLTAARGVIAAEVDRLAQLRNCIRQRLACLANEETQERRSALLEKISGTVEAGSAL